MKSKHNNLPEKHASPSLSLNSKLSNFAKAENGKENARTLNRPKDAREQTKIAKIA